MNRMFPSLVLIVSRRDFVLPLVLIIFYSNKSKIELIDLKYFALGWKKKKYSNKIVQNLDISAFRHIESFYMLLFYCIIREIREKEEERVDHIYYINCEKMR